LKKITTPNGGMGEGSHMPVFAKRDFLGLWTSCESGVRDKNESFFWMIEAFFRVRSSTTGEKKTKSSPPKTVFSRTGAFARSLLKNGKIKRTSALKSAEYRRL
jgi:hypothetical protein